MLYIFLSILCSVIIGNMLLYFSKNDKNDILLIFLGNYFFAAIFSFVQIKPGTLSFGTFEIVFGFITGFFFLYNFFVYQKNIALNGLSLSVGIMRVSVLIPTFMSVIFFDDFMSVVNLMGILVIVLAFWLITETSTLQKLIWIILLFFVSGATDSTLKIYNELGQPDQSPFVFILFSSAFICTLIWVVKTKRAFSLSCILFGFLLGIPNQLSTRFFLMGLETVPAPIAYPLTASSIVVFSIFSDIIFWRRMFTIKQRIALALLVAGIVLINAQNG